MAAAPWVCTLTDWSTPPQPMAWEAETGGGWTLTIDRMAEGFAWGVRDTGWDDDAARFRGGVSTDLETAKRQAEQSHAAGPVSVHPR